MARLTTNKATTDMSMYELTHNSCYIGENGAARYRDFETDVDARELARMLMCAYGEWKGIEDYGLDSDNELVDDDIFDDTMIENLMYEPTEIQGLIALFYRNLYAMADLREKLKAYEDAEEQGLLFRLPCKVGDTLYRIDTDETIENVEIEEYTIENIVISNWGDILFKYDAYDGIICALENITKGTLYLGFYRIFLTKEEAEQALAEMKGV